MGVEVLLLVYVAVLLPVCVPVLVWLPEEVPVCVVAAVPLPLGETEPDCVKVQVTEGVPVCVSVLVCVEV